VNESAAEELEEWRGHPVTQRFLRDLRKRRAELLEVTAGHLRSTDHELVAVARVKAGQVGELDEVLKILGGRE
jgi:hypothetical protein